MQGINHTGRDADGISARHPMSSDPRSVCPYVVHGGGGTSFCSLNGAGASAVKAELDSKEAHIAQLIALLDDVEADRSSVLIERDLARAEVARLTEQLEAETEHVTRKRIRADLAIADRAKACEVVEIEPGCVIVMVGARMFTSEAELLAYLMNGET